MTTEMFLAFFLAVAVVSVRAIYLLSQIRNAVEETKEIAAAEQVARAEHRRQTVVLRKQERLEKHVNGVTRAVNSVISKLSYELKTLESCVTPQDDWTSSASFLYEVKGVGFLKIGFTSWPNAPMLVGVSQALDSLDQECCKFLYPDEVERVVKYVTTCLHELLGQDI